MQKSSCRFHHNNYRVNSTKMTTKRPCLKNIPVESKLGRAAHGRQGRARARSNQTGEHDRASRQTCSTEYGEGLLSQLRVVLIKM